MFVRDLNGNEYPLQATTTHDFELNGNQLLSFAITPSKVNDAFIDSFSEMWEVVDDQDVAHKVNYARKRGEGKRLTIDVKATPLFFDAMDTDRIYEERNEHMTAATAFNHIFYGTEFEFNLVGTFYAVQWEGFGKGETRLAMFKRALDRYNAEFEINGNVVTLSNQIGRDTSFMYRHQLNASNIVQEIDATQLWTYAKGFGNFAEGEEQNALLIREYTSPLAAVVGIRHAPPIYNGSITTTATMDEQLRTLVDNSLQISVSTDVHDLRKQGYPLAQPELGDRVFLMDERIGLDEEVRINNITVVKDWLGNVLDLKLVIGSESLVKRHQSGLTAAVDRITDMLEGREKIPYNVLPNAVRQATEALQSAQTQLTFDNGIIGIDPNNPNLLTTFTSAGIGISNDGGATFQNALTGNGLVATVITSGQINANNVSIGNNNVMLDSTGLGVYSGSTLTAKLTGGYLNFYDFVTGESVGRFQSSFLGGSPETKGISLNLDNNKYISFGYYKSAEFGYERLMSINADLYSTNAGKFGVNFLSDGHLNGRTLYFDDIGNTTGIRTALTNDAQGTERRVLAMMGNAGAYMMDVDGVIGSGTETYSKRIGFFENNNYLFGPAGEIGNTRSYTDFWMGDRSLRFGIDQFHNQSAIYNSANNDLILASYGGIGLSHIDAGGATSSRLTVDSNSVDIWQDLDMHGWKIINSSTINDIIERLNALESA